MAINVYVVNESTSFGSPTQVENLAAALNVQVIRDFSPLWGIGPVTVTVLNSSPVPVGGWVLHILDTSDQQGALGYHDEDGNEVPYARVFVHDTRQSGMYLSEVASHELLEMLADPHINLTALNTDNKLYAYEVGDPVQDTPYLVRGFRVANFALPAYFDPNTTKERVDFRGVLSAPFTVSLNGYMSYLDLNNVAAGWQAVFGAKRSAAPAPEADDRLERRLSK